MVESYWSSIVGIHIWNKIIPYKGSNPCAFMNIDPLTIAKVKIAFYDGEININHIKS